MNIVGGCCGTSPAYIAKIAEKVQGYKPRTIPDVPRYSCYCGSQPLIVGEDAGFLMIGERANVTGSKKFARLVKEKKSEEALRVAADQVEGGANMIDVNMDEGLLDSEIKMVRFLNLIADDPDVNRTPVMVDSSKFDVIEAGLKCLAGKGVVNSISMKEGEEKFLEQARTVRRYGACCERPRANSTWLVRQA